MCGIVGAFRPGDPELPRALRAATAALRHRGPDDEGLEILPAGDSPNAVGLGVRRLAILDLSPAGHQPMHDPRTGNWIVHNGEVYNFRELRRELETHGHRFHSQSDTEVLLQSYAAWGPECVHRWRGMFAAAIWDAGQRRLVLFRDRLGIKPLYYCSEGNRFAFASEVRALRSAGWVGSRLDLTALESVLSFGAVEEPYTIVAGVRALPPGQYLVWEAGQLEIAPYWQPFAERERTTVTREAVAAILTDAVRDCLVSDVPVGVFLSGGIDSSSLVSLLSALAVPDLKTFSVVFGSEGLADAFCSGRVAEEFRTQHHKLDVDETEPLHQLPRALAAMDQPTADGINTYLVSGIARPAGVKVALSGLGGDEVFGGYSTFQRAPQLARLQALCASLPGSLRHLLGKLILAWPGAGDRRRKLRTLVAEDSVFADPVFLLRAFFMPEQITRLLTSEARGAVDFAARRETLQSLLAQTLGLDSFTRISWLELRHYMLNTLLRDTDQMSMAHGLEVRVPLLDHRLVEAVLSLPESLKANGRFPKHLLVDALPRPLPEEVVRRPKRGFALPFERWLRGPLQKELEETLLTPSSALKGVLRQEGIAEVYRQFQKGRLSWSRVWVLHVLKRWVEAAGLRP